jgi:hypothetical protein
MMRDRGGIFKNDQEAIQHCKELAQHFREGSLLDDQDLEIGEDSSRVRSPRLKAGQLASGSALHRRFQCIKMENK